MTQSSQPASLLADQKEAFTVMVLRYLDDACSTEEIEQLHASIAEIAPYRELFVEICRLKGNLHEVYSPKRAKLHWPQRPLEIRSEIPIDLEPWEDEPAADPNAETMMGKMSVEDTAHPLPKPLENEKNAQ